MSIQFWELELMARRALLVIAASILVFSSGCQPRSSSPTASQSSTLDASISNWVAIMTPDASDEGIRQRLSAFPHSAEEFTIIADVWRKLDKLNAAREWTVGANPPEALWLLKTSDIKDPLGLGYVLCQQADAVSSYVWTRLSVDTQRILSREHSLGQGDRDEIGQHLTRDLNAIIQGPSIYNTERFRDTMVSPESWTQLERRGLKSETLQGASEEFSGALPSDAHEMEYSNARINRMLLEDTYRERISGERTRIAVAQTETDARCAELEHQLERVLGTDRAARLKEVSTTEYLFALGITQKYRLRNDTPDSYLRFMKDEVPVLLRRPGEILRCQAIRQRLIEIFGDAAYAEVRPFWSWIYGRMLEK